MHYKEASDFFQFPHDFSGDSGMRVDMNGREGGCAGHNCDFKILEPLGKHPPGPHTSNYIFRKNVVFTYYFDFLNVKKRYYFAFLITFNAVEQAANGVTSSTIYANCTYTHSRSTAHCVPMLWAVSRSGPLWLLLRLVSGPVVLLVVS